MRKALAFPCLGHVMEDHAGEAVTLGLTGACFLTDQGCCLRSLSLWEQRELLSHLEGPSQPTPEVVKGRREDGSKKAKAGSQRSDLRACSVQSFSSFQCFEDFLTLVVSAPQRATCNLHHDPGHRHIEIQKCRKKSAMERYLPFWYRWQRGQVLVLCFWWFLRYFMKVFVLTVVNSRWGGEEITAHRVKQHRSGRGDRDAGKGNDLPRVTHHARTFIQQLLHARDCPRP